MMKRERIIWIVLAVVVALMGWVAYEFVTALSPQQTGCLIQWCSDRNKR